MCVGSFYDDATITTRPRVVVVVVVRAQPQGASFLVFITTGAWESAKAFGTRDSERLRRRGLGESGVRCPRSSGGVRMDTGSWASSSPCRVIVAFIAAATTCASFVSAADVNSYPRANYHPKLTMPDPSCQCIPDVVEFLNATAPNVTNRLLDAGQCAGFSPSSGQTCMNVTTRFVYGQGCKAHDLEMVGTACANLPVSSRPAWCYREWCFVDNQNCSTREKAPSTYLYNSVKIPTSSRLDYSYQTCGDVDAFTGDGAALSQLRGVHVRVSVPDIRTPTKYLLRGGMYPEGPT